MRELKLQLNIYSPRNYRRLEQHLSAMAAKGWMLEQPDSLVWRYRRCEPKQLRFSILFFQCLNWEEPYRSRAEEAGWRFVADYAGMQIFCTEDPALAPIKVDATPRWKAIHKATQETDRNRWVAIVILALVVLGNTVITAIPDPVEVLSDGPRLMYGILMLCTLLVVAADVLHYFNWRYKARRMYQKQGVFPEPGSNLPILNTGAVLLPGLLITTLVVEDPYGRLVSLLNIASILIAVAVAQGYNLIKKRRSANVKVNVATSLAIALVVFLLLGMAQSVLLKNYDFTCRPEDMDLTVQALTGEDAAEQSCLVEEQRSVFLEDLTGRNIVTDCEGEISLQYRITKACQSGLTEFAHENCLPSRLQEKTTALDASLWQAEGAWLYAGSNGNYTYFIYYSDRAATLLTSWELTDEQIAVAAAALQAA